MRLSPCVLVQPDGWARGEREGYGGPYDVTSLSLSQTRGRWVHHCVSGLVYMMMINCTPVPAIAQGVQQKHNYSTKSDSFPVSQRRHSAPSPLNSTAAWPKFGGGA